jgi:protein transport protein SEC24
MTSPEDSPPQMRCIFERLKDDGIYLLENGIVMYLWIGQNVSTNSVQNLFGSESAQLNLEKCKLLELDTPLSINVRSFIKRINEQHQVSMKVSCCFCCFF